MRVRVQEEKYMEQIEFLTKKDDIQPEDSLGKAYACKHGADEFFDVPEGHSIIGLYGFTSTNVFTEGGVERFWDNIRGCGFITMNLNA